MRSDQCYPSASIEEPVNVPLAIRERATHK
jgi:hypothetical protein